MKNNDPISPPPHNPASSSKKFTLLRIGDLLEKVPMCRSWIYDQVGKRLFPPPVGIGARAVAWVEAEVDQVVEAKVAGKTEAEIQELVGELVAARATSGGAQ